MAVEWELAADRAAQGCLNEAQARSVINSILAHSGQKSITFYKTNDWLTEWLKDKSASREASTTAKYKPVIERFLKHLGPRAKMGLAHIKPAERRLSRP